jgi:hypothetical protein
LNQANQGKSRPMMFSWCTRSFSSVSRLRAAASASGASGGVVLLKVEQRGELSEEETQGLTVDRAALPLVIELEYMDELRQGGGLWSADNILWVTLNALWPAIVVASALYRTLTRYAQTPLRGGWTAVFLMAEPGTTGENLRETATCQTEDVQAKKWEWKKMEENGMLSNYYYKWSVSTNKWRRHDELMTRDDQ